MQYILHITQLDRTLSIEEVLSLYNIKQYKELNDTHIIIDAKTDNLKLYQRLAYTNEVYTILFSATKREIIQKIKEYNWNAIYKHNFAVRIINKEKSREREFAAIIYHNLKNPKVNLKNPETLIVFFEEKNRFYCCTKVWQNNKSFLNRKAHLKPILHPTSLNPRLAKACINLVISKKDYLESKNTEKIILLDPFCGVGGILVEAELMNVSSIGIDLEESMIKAAEENINYYKKENEYKNYTLINNDATKISATELKQKITAIVTDLPYGKNTKKIEHDKLYLEFLNNASTLTTKAVIMFPDFIDYKTLIKKSKKWRITSEFTYYLHKSLSKKIVILIKK